MAGDAQQLWDGSHTPFNPLTYVSSQTSTFCRILYTAQPPHERTIHVWFYSLRRSVDYAVQELRA